MYVREYGILVEDYFYSCSDICRSDTLLLDERGRFIGSCLGITHQPFRLMSKGGELWKITMLLLALFVL